MEIIKVACFFTRADKAEEAATAAEAVAEVLETDGGGGCEADGLAAEDADIDISEVFVLTGERSTG